MALVGRPNVGKSTLLNTLIGEKLSIVTPRAQTTRERVLGIYTVEDAQIVFVDTPGLLEPRYLLQESMLEQALLALRESDLALLLLDPTDPEETFPAAPALDALRRRRDLLVAINKIDLAAPETLDRLAAWARELFGVEPFRVSAASGQGTGELRDALVARLPASPLLYPPDEIAVQPVRFFVAELVRETIFEDYHAEVPYATVVRVEEFHEAEDPILIRANIFVERESQKAILIGERGAGIKRLGQRAREKIEAFVGARVYLELWVKSMPRWRKQPGALRLLGYAVPREQRGSGGGRSSRGGERARS
ncbi:MAG: GTPase Era [Gemmatimonadetes bacterium]|nr:GTPase Era [Gemmatimonadota bacterium]